ncbi:MAG: hypothetical protein IPP72_19880 [Chitinophagaceae bacterium]|nr:hypothetical protein [Chitinophagaceae bacterium]
MKATNMFIKDVTKIVTGRVLAITLAGILALPVAAYSQEQEADAQDIEVEAPSTSSGPWQNSAGATIGTRDNSNPTPARPATDPRLGPGGGTLARGPVTTAGGPGGNPDVPFDDNMNLAFLVAAVVFAFTVVRKKMRLKAVQVQK